MQQKQQEGEIMKQSDERGNRAQHQWLREWVTRELFYKLTKRAQCCSSNCKQSLDVETVKSTAAVVFD